MADIGGERTGVGGEGHPTGATGPAIAVGRSDTARLAITDARKIEPVPAVQEVQVRDLGIGLLDETEKPRREASIDFDDDLARRVAPADRPDGTAVLGRSGRARV